MTLDVPPRTRWSLGRTLLPLAVVFLAVGLSTAVMGPFLALFLSSEVQIGPLQVTIFLIGAPLAAVAASAAVARLSDRPGIRRRLIIAASVTGVLGAALTAVFRDYSLLPATALTATAFAGALYPQAFAYARKSSSVSSRAVRPWASAPCARFSHWRGWVGRRWPCYCSPMAVSACSTARRRPTRWPAWSPSSC